MSRSGRAIALGFMASCLIAGAARAQDGRVASAWLPPRDIPGGSTLVVPAQAQDAASLMVRIDRLESQLRAQNGDIEQMQFQIKRLEDQLRKKHTVLEKQVAKQSAKSLRARDKLTAETTAGNGLKLGAKKQAPSDET